MKNVPSIREIYSNIKPMDAVPTKRQMEWYRREKSIFFHFGINTYTGREWGDGTDSPTLFNPERLDCRQWIKDIKEAGFTTAILTAKHHDGFCLWQTESTDYSVKSSPYKNGKGDVVREFTDACNEFGIKAGLYLSPWDRHEQKWGTDEYNDFYVSQLEELFGNYGKIWECWWDGAGSEVAHYDFERWVSTVRRLQPDAVIFGARGAAPYVDVRWVGNENGMAGKPCWGSIDEISIFREITKELNSGKADGERFVPAEVDVSIRPGWFYHSEQDDKVRSPENLLRLWFTSVGSNAGLLLNIPPNRDGLLNQTDIDAIKRLNGILSEGLKVNLAEGAKIPEGAEPLVNKNADSVYASDSLNPEITFSFNEKITFNTVVLDEVIEFGHKIRGFEILAEICDEWVSLCSGECVGYRCAEHFDTVCTDKVKLRITDAKDCPVIRFFGLYRFDEALFKSEKARFSAENLMRSNLVTTEHRDECFDVNLGGIIPFNKILFDGDKIEKYELYIFDGSKYVLQRSGDGVEKGKITCIFDEVIDMAYGFRIKVKWKSECVDDLRIDVFYN